MAKKLWGGRFKKAAHAGFERFSASFRWDEYLAPHDLKIDAAHVTALKECGVFTASEQKKLISAMEAMALEWHYGKLKLPKDSEDVHTALHEEIKRRVGRSADKLHTARSRNDLVAQSSRLFVKAESEVIIAHLSALQSVWRRKAEAYVDVLVPGMTHLQNAQVLSIAHIFLSYVEMLERSKDSFNEARRQADVCVLGSGAIAGVTFNLNQKKIAKTLGLSRVTRNSYDTAGDRDYVLNFLFACSSLGLQLSRIAEDLMLGQLRSTDLLDIDEAFCTGSSMMPQKKNADFVELVRGASGVFLGNFISLATTLKGLPTSYNRDLQWDKKPLIESAHLSAEILGLFTEMAHNLSVKTERTKALLADESLYATDLADSLVKKGVSFKEAHEQVGKIVALSEENGVPVSKIGLDLLKKCAPLLDGAVYDLFDAKHSVQSKKTQGSTNLVQVKQQILYWKKRLGR